MPLFREGLKRYEVCAAFISHTTRQVFFMKIINNYNHFSKALLSLDLDLFIRIF